MPPKKTPHKVYPKVRMDSSNVKVVFFHRKPYKGVNFSIENLFAHVRSELGPEITWTVHEAKHFSRGFVKRLLISLAAFLSQGDVNHVTGDIHFIAIFLRKRRTILTIHDVGFMSHPNFVVRWILKVFWLYLPIRSVSVVTAVSEATKRAVLSHVKVDASKIKVIYDPILPIFRTERRPFNKRQPTILQIGTKENKNLPRLIEALQGLNCKLEIIGLLSDRLAQLLSLSGIPYSNSSNLTNQEIFDKYLSADIVAFVSTSEGFGLPIIEANVVGRAVITSSLSSMPEIAGDAAHLVDPYNVASIREGIERLINDDGYREQLILKGFSNYKRFHVRHVASQYSQLYRELAASS